MINRLLTPSWIRKDLQIFIGLVGGPYIELYFRLLETGSQGQQGKILNILDLLFGVKLLIK